jgi:hypothetical protein
MAAQAPEYPEGGYIGKVTQQALVKAGTGTPQLVIKFTVERFWNKEKKAEEPVAERHTRTIYRTITAKTAEYVKQDLENLGFTGESLSELDPKTPGYFDLTGHEINVFVKHEADQESNLREKWGISQYSGSKPIEGEPVTNFAELDELLGFSGKSAGPKAAPKKAAAAGTTPTGAGSNGHTAGALSDDELAAKMVELVRSKGNTLAKKSLGVNLLTLKLQRDDIKKAQSEEFLKAYDGAVWKYDGTAITVE